MNEDWKTKRYRYQITLKSGKVVTTDYYDTYQDLENFIKTGYAGVFTPTDGFVDLPMADIQAVQPIDEGQMSGGGPAPEQPDVPAVPGQPANADGSLSISHDVPKPPAGAPQ